MDPPKKAEQPAERDKHLLRIYGKIPSRGNLLHHQLEGRKYFDSGDFALSQAKKSSDIGAVSTGSEHPSGEIYQTPHAPYRAPATLAMTLIKTHEPRRRLAS
ncbi:hypothetical protein F5883DRAFT_587740 [Diaporthe sp. PMI_573]|nr:hypothetical protein F5883DRAFT_587740 [Diaporthaceae sp. PMI_573]